ncbi:Peptidoglycan-binding lysin domain protein [Thermoanaerobacter mathranii subsp. mathranii str. A3]|uniref:Peptidoglycan-binding lysin domain protein n=2 Tax=Thermoanaerobacter TaxID=1754 RepID=D3T5R6_THEIA|nr:MULTISPECIES: SPOCS domain-containing protein [Thermoanaerobacter]ADD03439.1 Peptidoglycan-binding lysin domain protein [Thermoanaerobacter italicus Ab9]ADH61806.1 Peptidoglycan-binding lysin domain protein [Thermoanaerobacter mathranii subsp. mathranii str. A3]
MPQVYKDILEFDSVSGIYDTQLLVESDIIVPENEPDVLVLLALNPKTYINEVFVTEGKVQFEGKLALDILYLGEKNGELERIEKEIDYSHVIEDEGIDKRSRYMLVAKVENVDYKLVNSRKISVKAVIKIQCRLVVSNKKEVVIGAEDSIKIQALKKKVKLMHTVGQNSIEVFVKDKIKVPEGEAPIQKVIKTDVEVKPEEIKITDNKVIVQGSVLCNILYISQEGEFGNLAANLNYANFVDIPGALSYMSAKTQEEVIDVSTTVLEDEKGENTILDIEATIRVKVQVLETEERELPIDAYGTKGYIQPVRENLTVIEELQSYKSQFVVKTNVELPSLAKRFIDAVVIPVISDYSVDVDKLVLEGILDYTILYLSEEGSVKPYRDEYPFKTFIEISQVKGPTLVDIKISHVSYEIIAMKEIELKFAIDNTVDLLVEKEIEAIVDLKEIEAPRESDNKHSIVVYMIQKGETLWDIAKRYRVGLEELISANGLEEEKVSEGMKLIIPMEE